MLAFWRRCLRVRQSRPASAVHTVFCSVVPWFVKDLRSCLAVVMALHEPLAVALHGFPASLSDELFARPRADPRVLFPHASSRAACGCVSFGCTQHHSLPSPPRAARVEGVVSRALVRRREHLAARLEPVPRRSAHCAFRQTLLCLVSRDRLLWFFEFTSPSESGDQSEYGCDRGLVFTASASRVDSRRSSVVATLRSCRRCGCVPRGQRALLDADMLELMNLSACQVEPVVVESCAPSVLVLSPTASTSSAASGRCSRMSFPRGLVEGLLLPESSLRAAPVALLRLLLLDEMVLSLFCHVVDIMCFLTDLLCFVFLLHDCEKCGRRDPLVHFLYLRFFTGFLNCLRRKPLLLHLL